MEKRKKKERKARQNKKKMHKKGVYQLSPGANHLFVVNQRLKVAPKRLNLKNHVAFLSIFVADFGIGFKENSFESSFSI